MTDPRMPDHRVEFVPSPRWVRVYFNGQSIGDSQQVMLLRESGRLPVYCFPRKDVRMKYLEPSGATGSGPKGESVYWHIHVGDRRAEDAAYTFRCPPQDCLPLDDYIAFVWDKMDAWFEEDEEVFVHARDPFSRVDVLHSSRHIKVIIDANTVADSTRPRLLFETGLPTRYYLPKQDIRTDLLETSDKTTRCPYKGEAHYYSVRIGDKLYKDFAWYYRYPVPECTKIQDLVCFFNERVELYEDGTLLPRPVSAWA